MEEKYQKTKSKSRSVITRLLTFFVALLCALCLLPAPGAKAASAEKFLFVGNSLTFYNNVPEIFQRIAAADGRSVAASAALYGGRTLLVHARAIKAVIRTKGNAKDLTASEKKYFCNKGSSIFVSSIYDNYASLVWDYSRNKPKHYDRIVLQIYYKEGSGDASADNIYNAISIILKAMASSDTAYIINVTAAKYSSTTAQLAKTQTAIDGYVNTAIKKVKTTSSLKKYYGSIKAAYVGRAFCNYLYYSGTNTAIGREPAAFNVMNMNGGKGFLNDLFYGDGLHYTPLGSYLEAATLYQTIYGGVRNTCGTYRGGSKTVQHSVDDVPCTQFNRLYNNGAGFKDSVIIRYAAYIAEATMRYSMRLRSKSQAEAWKATAASQYEPIGYKVSVTFNGNGADYNTFGTQVYYYRLSDDGFTMRFAGNIGRAGYDMLGWRFANDKQNTARYSMNNNVSSNWVRNHSMNSNGKVTLYAVWSPHIVSITYATGNGGPVSGPQTLTYGVQNQELMNVPDRIDAVLLGWSVNPNTSTLEFWPSQILTDDDIEWLYKTYGQNVTLYAIWAPSDVPSEVPVLQVIEDMSMSVTPENILEPVIPAEAPEPEVPEETRDYLMPEDVKPEDLQIEDALSAEG